MKMRPCKRLYIVLILSIVLLSMIPLGVTAQEDDPLSWDIYQVTQTEIIYANITTIWIQHPMNGSLVSNNQKLTFIVVPFDADEYFYNIKVYKNDIHMYTCNREEVYVLNIYTDNAINDIVTVTITLNDKEVLKLTYYAVLLVSSVSEDVTEAYLKYLAERGNQTMTGRQLISMRDQSLRDINLVGSTLFWSLILAGVAIFFVLIFQIIKIVNLFSGMVWFGSSLIWLSNINEIDGWMRSLPTVTPDDVFIFYAKIITVTLIVVGANLFYLMTYKATSTRLSRIEYESIDKQNRTKGIYSAVLGRKRGKMYWRLQDSWSAIRRVLWKADYEIRYDRGNISDTYRYIKVRPTPENIDITKPMRTLQRSSKQIASRLTFYTKDKETGEVQPNKDKAKEHDFEIWKKVEVNNPFSSPTPVLVLDGEPEFKRIYEKEAYDNIIEEMKEIAKESSDPKFIKNIRKRIKRLEKTTKNPKNYVVYINPANKDAYSIEDYLIDIKTLDKLSALVNKLKEEKHKLEIEKTVTSYEEGEQLFSQFDKAIKEYEENMMQRSEHP